MDTTFSLQKNSGTDDRFEAGEVKGNTLYHSGLIPYGKVSNGTVTIGFRQYIKQ